MAEGRKTSMSSLSSTEGSVASSQEPVSPTLKLDLHSGLEKHEGEPEKEKKVDDEMEVNNEPRTQTRKNEEEEKEENKEESRKTKTRPDEEGNAKGDVKEGNGNKEENVIEKENEENGNNDAKSPENADVKDTETTEKKRRSKESGKKKEGKEKKKGSKSKNKEKSKRKDSKRNEESDSQEKEGNSKKNSSDKKRSDNSEQQDKVAIEGKTEEPDQTMKDNVDSDKKKDKVSCPQPVAPSSASPKVEENKEKEKENESVTGTQEKDLESGKQISENNAEENDLISEKSKEQTTQNSAKQINLEDEERKELLIGDAKEVASEDEKQKEESNQNIAKEADCENEEMSEKVSKDPAEEALIKDKLEKKEKIRANLEKIIENERKKDKNEASENAVNNSELETAAASTAGEMGIGGDPDEKRGNEEEENDMEEEETEEDLLPKRGERTTGYLNMKKKGAFKFWKRYYFVMEGQILKYYKSRQDYQNLKNFKGTLDVFAMERVKERKQGFLKHHHHPFDIQRRSKSTVHLAASTIEERERWLMLLQEALKNHKTPLRYSCTELPEGIGRTSSEQDLRKCLTLPTSSSQDRSYSTSSSDTEARNAQSEEGLDNRRSASRESHISVHPRVRFGVALNVRADDLGSVKLKKARDSLSAKNKQVEELPEEKRENETKEENDAMRVEKCFGVKLQSIKRDDPDKISPTSLPKHSREPVLPIQKNSLAAKLGDTSPRKSPTPIHKGTNNVPAIPLSKSIKQFVAKSQEDLDERSSEVMEENGEKPKEDRKKTEENMRNEKEEQKDEEEERENKSVTDGVSPCESIKDKTFSEKTIKIDDKEGNTTHGEEEGKEIEDLTHKPLSSKLSHASVKVIHYSETENLTADEDFQIDQISSVKEMTSENTDRSAVREDSSSDTEKTTNSSKSTDVIKSEDNKNKEKKEEPKQSVPGEIPLVTPRRSPSPSILPKPLQDCPEFSPSSSKKNAKDPLASPKPSEQSRTNTGSSTKSSSASHKSDTDNETPPLRVMKGGRSGSVCEAPLKNKEDRLFVRERTNSEGSLAQKTRMSLLRIFKKEKSKAEKLPRLSTTEEPVVTRKPIPEAEEPPGKEGERGSMKNEEQDNKTDFVLSEESEFKNPKPTDKGEDAVLNEPIVKLRIRFDNEDLQVRSSYCSVCSHSSVEEDPKPRIPEKSRIREKSPSYDVPQNNRPIPGAHLQMMYTEDEPEEKAPVDGCITQAQIESILDSKEKRKKSISQYPGPFLSIPVQGGSRRGSDISTTSANSASSDTDRPPYLSSISTESDDPLPTTNFLGNNRSSVDSVTLRENGAWRYKEKESDASINETVATVNATVNPKQTSEAILCVEQRKRKSDAANRSSFTTSELVVVNEEEETDNDDSMTRGGDVEGTKTKKQSKEEKEVEQKEKEEEKGEKKEEEEEEEREEKEKEETVKEEEDEEADEVDYFPTLNFDEEPRPTSEVLQVRQPGNSAGLRTSGIMALSKYLEQMKDDGEEERTTNCGVSRLGHSVAIEKLKETLQDE